MRVMAKHAYRRQPLGFALHDPLAVAIAIEPSLVEVEALPLDILTSSSQAAGATIEDRRPLTDANKVGAWTSTAIRVDTTRALALFSERVLRRRRTLHPHRVAVVGGLNMDYVVRGATLPSRGETVTGESLSIFPGGKGANQAVAAARAGAEVTLIGRVGNDGDGDALLANGASVRIHGLVNTGVKYNGRRGEVVEFIHDRGRYLVRVRKGEETEEVSLKRENLTAR